VSTDSGQVSRHSAAIRNNLAPLRLSVLPLADADLDQLRVRALSCYCVEGSAALVLRGIGRLLRGALQKPTGEALFYSR
jgi:hypothetical protein